MSVQLEDGLKLVEAELPALQKLVKVIDWHVGGSTAINGEGNDVDLIVLSDSIEFGKITDPSWKHLGQESYNSDGQFDSYRKGLLNLILTDDEEYYNAWKIARAVCSALGEQYNLRDRAIRVLVHSIVCDKVGV